MEMNEDPRANTQSSNAIVTSERERRETVQVAVGVESRAMFNILHCPELRQKAMEFLLDASMAWSLKLLRPHDLPTVTRLNAFDALARNALILEIPVELLESDDDNSPFLLQGHQSLQTRNYPGQLAPTLLQKSIKHHPWLDLLPIPGLRDNILRGIEAGLLDEECLCQELVCDLLNLDATSKPSLMIWGDSWDISGWEFSPDFFRKWACLLAGSPEVWRATNYWRAKRCEMRLEYILN